jgi:hypothetical protein
MTTIYLVLTTLIFAILLAFMISQRSPDCIAIPPPPDCIARLHSGCIDTCYPASDGGGWAP